MKYLLDTNTCIRFLNRRSEPTIKRLSSITASEIAVCSVVKAELFAGAKRSQQPERTLERQREFLDHFVSLTFDDAAAEVYSTIRAALETAGTPIGPNDLLIASIAMANDLVLVTTNTKEFSRVEGLKVEDWNVEA
jgi:tRNA(fMet)-specific endonuclease VapC